MGGINTMKKNICIILSMIITFGLLTGCTKGSKSNNITKENTNNSQSKDNSSKDKEKDKDKDTIIKIGTYYPFEKNIKYMYAGTGNEYATYSVYVDYISENRQQIRVNNGGTETVKVLENKDGELRLIYSKGESYYRENFTSKINDNPEILLKEPLVEGNSWTLLDGSKRTITNIKAPIVTPLATYECIEVTNVGKESTVKDYYAANIGLVKTLFTSNGMEVSSSLSKMEKDAPFVQTVKFYYPNINDSINYITNKEISFNTNDLTKALMEKNFKEATNENVGNLISPNTKIKSLYLNKDNMVYLDFSKEFTEDMKVGAGYEGQILQCITNTVGDYYMVKKVYITVEGEPYSSGHILMKKGEAFIVDYKNTK